MLGFVECHLPGKLLTWSLTELVGTTPVPEGCDPPRGVERLPFHFTWKMERNGAVLGSLSHFGFPPARGELGSLQQKLLVLFLPQHHPLTLFSVSQLWCL